MKKLTDDRQAYVLLGGLPSFTQTGYVGGPVIDREHYLCKLFNNQSGGHCLYKLSSKSNNISIYDKLGGPKTTYEQFVESFYVEN